MLAHHSMQTNLVLRVTALINLTKPLVRWTRNWWK